MGTLTKLSKPLPEHQQVSRSWRRLIDRKTASVMLLLILQMSIGIIMMSYRSCDRTGEVRDEISYNSTVSSDDIVYVQVIGRVKRPGVYAVRSGSRIHDILSLAGGALPTANLDDINLARKITQEEQIIVP